MQSQARKAVCRMHISGACRIWRSCDPYRGIGIVRSGYRRWGAGRQLDRLQRGIQPDNFKPMASIGKGVEQIRVWHEAGSFRVIHAARLADAV